ncbi:MAG TPA: type II toxin-antitoxin system PrlF family antitoxin [Longimicrobium sp.]|nr:type II toxin-antitoxin system PrlF family antitoxin [Longimicrobium sp.]
MPTTSPSSAIQIATDDGDLVVLAYLSFLEEQMERHPGLIQPLDELLARAGDLVRNIQVNPDEDLGEDVCLPD